MRRLLVVMLALLTGGCWTSFGPLFGESDFDALSGAEGEYVQLEPSTEQCEVRVAGACYARLDQNRFLLTSADGRSFVSHVVGAPQEPGEALGFVELRRGFHLLQKVEESSVLYGVTRRSPAGFELWSMTCDGEIEAIAMRHAATPDGDGSCIFRSAADLRAAALDYVALLEGNENARPPNVVYAPVGGTKNP